VLAALRGTDRTKLREALVALEAGAGAVDGEICAALIELLDDDSKEVRRRAAGALGLAAATPAHHALLERALADPQPRRRWCAAFALSRSGTFSDAVARCAVEALASADGDVRWAAAEIACEAAAQTAGERRPDSRCAGLGLGRAAEDGALLPA
jgi:HEAT repeat protein